MNNNKPKSSNVLVLAGCMAVLVLVAIFTFKPGGDQPAPPAQTGQAAGDTTPKPTPAADSKLAKAGEAGISWLEASRLPKIEGEVKGGRNPFVDLMLPSKPIVHQGSTPPVVPPPVTPPKPPVDTPTQLTLTKTLEWTTHEVLTKAFEKENLVVELRAGKRANQVVLSGYPPDFDRAVELIKNLDVPPPIPPFVLSGVVITPSVHLAVISLNGKQYSLVEGDTIPGLKWTVKQVDATSVTLTNGRQSKALRLSGGSPS